ncbi:HK97 gp10 family phage protein [Defluviimonas sp. D31]|uniref:HK97-gp10 family putative phage morphogenesis protein n=1 Tax=Defluviimonas sp. D31 TaxID=3083253 RepID=UPI0029700B11|nr:HK97-gp10 family putative phage morphogenesis protein [Defluviimonas sp. D31]MDW4550881.1 HK97 gp10 family phage protein [Defluviimonas sp. D31]
MITIEVKGTEEIKALLGQVAPRHAVNIARATIHGVAGDIRDMAKEEAPKDEGVLRRAIKAKRRRMEFGRIRSDVVIERGKGAKADAFYWRFVEYGTSRLPARPYFLPSIRRIEAALPGILRDQFVKKFTAALARQRRRGGGT